ANRRLMTLIRRYLLELRATVAVPWTVRLMKTIFWRLPKLSWITALRRAPRVLFLLVGIRTRSQNLRWSPPLKCCWPMTWKYAWIIMAAIRQLQLSPMRFCPLEAPTALALRRRTTHRVMADSNTTRLQADQQMRMLPTGLLRARMTICAKTWQGSSASQ